MRYAFVLEMLAYLLLFGAVPMIFEARWRSRQPREGREGAARMVPTRGIAKIGPANPTKSDGPTIIHAVPAPHNERARS